MPPETPSRIRAMPKVCLRWRQKLARGLKVVLVDDDLGRSGRRPGGAVRPGRDIRPPEVAVDAARAQKPAQRLGLDLVTYNGKSRLSHPTEASSSYFVFE